MKPSQTWTIDPETLLIHREFLCRIAQGILRDSSDAEDVVQDSWTRIIERPPQHTQGIKSYLATLTKGLAISKRRSEQRRRARENAVSSQESLPSSAQVVERLALQKELAESILSLNENLRTIVLLRFYEGLPPREIAKKLDLPLETVKSRQKNALHQLREKLKPRKEGLIAMAAYPMRSSGLTLGSSIPWLVGGGVVASLVLGLTLAVTSDPPGPQKGAMTPPSVASATPVIAAPHLPTAQRTSLIAEPAQESSGSQEKTSDSFVIRCQTQEGIDVEGAKIWVYQYEDQATGQKSSGYRLTGEFVANHEGRCTCPSRPFSGGCLRMIYATREGEWVGIAYRNGTKDPQELTVVMWPTITLKGSIDVSPEFSPRETLVSLDSIRSESPPQVPGGIGDFFSRDLLEPNNDLPPPLSCRPDDFGRFILKNVPKGAMLHGRVTGEGLGEELFWIQTATAEEELHFDMKREGTIEGVVRIGQRPLANAKVKLQRKGEVRLPIYECLTDENGQFLFRGLGQDTHDILQVESEANAVFQPVLGLEVKPGENFEISINAAPSVRLFGVVSDRDTDRPVSKVGISVTTRKANGEKGPAVGHGLTDDEGRYQIIVPEGDLYVYVSSIPQGYAYSRFRERSETNDHQGFFLTLKATEKERSFDLKIPKRPKGSVTLTVRDQSGHPLPNIAVFLRCDESFEDIKFPFTWNLKTQLDGTWTWNAIPNSQVTIHAGNHFLHKVDTLRVKDAPVNIELVLIEVELEAINVSQGPVAISKVVITRSGNSEPSRLESGEDVDLSSLHLPAGTYQITVHAVGYKPRSHSITLPSEDPSLRFMLRRKD